MRTYKMNWLYLLLFFVFSMWVLGIEPTSSGRAVCALSHWAISPVPYFKHFLTSSSYHLCLRYLYNYQFFKQVFFVTANVIYIILEHLRNSINRAGGVHTFNPSTREEEEEDLCEFEVSLVYKS